MGRLDAISLVVILSRCSQSSPALTFSTLTHIHSFSRVLDLPNLEYIKYEDLLWDLAADYPRLILGKLENLKIQTREDTARMLRSSLRLLRLGQLRSLELTYPPMDHNLQQIYWLQTKLTNLMAHYAKHFELDSLTLNGLCPTENQRMFLNCFKSLRSLTYRLICKLTPLIEGEMTEVWHALSLPRGTLECLSLQFPELEEYSSTPVYTIWSFMGELTKLTKFELIGAVELVPRLIPHLNAHQIWPPNLQHFTFAITTQSQGFTESMIDQSIIALSDHSDIWKAMPSLKTITLAPDMIEWSGRDELEDWLIPDGVELYAWSLEEQAAFPKPRPVVE